MQDIPSLEHHGVPQVHSNKAQQPVVPLITAHDHGV